MGRTQILYDNMKALIGTIREAPQHVLDNEYIHTGYRIGFNTTCKVLNSLFMLHNESVNVWTHLIGVFIFLWFIIYTAIKLGPKIESELHFRIMDKFDTLYHMADDTKLCEDDNIHNITDELLNIYDKHIKLEDLKCTLNTYLFTGEENEDHWTNYVVEDPSNATEDVVDPNNFEYMLDKIETYIYSMMNGLQKLSKRMR